VIAWKIRYAPERIAAQNRLPLGMKFAKENAYRPSVTKLIEIAE